MADHRYRDESYPGDREEMDPEEDNEEPEVRDLGFIVDDRDDRRITTIGGTWDRLDDLDTDEALEEDETGRLSLDPDSGAPPVDAFATLYNLNHLEAEEQEEDFVETSMLAVDPDENAGAHDFTSGDLDADGRLEITDLAGRAPGVARGFGTSVPMDLGAEGFEVRDNPLMQPQDTDQPFSNDRLSDEALGVRDVDEMGDEADLERLADRAARFDPASTTENAKNAKGRKR